MRIFQKLDEAIEEIRRDLAKSPELISTRVQHTQSAVTAKEAINYSFSIPAASMPTDHFKLALIGKHYFESWSKVEQMVAWMALESEKRLMPNSQSARYTGPSEIHHPELAGMKEGNHFSYTYRERMIGMLPAMESVLSEASDSRRAYWPIFRELDSYRASDYTRIPCTIGYHFMMREVPMKGPQLHITSMMRSCDFDKFFLADLWFTHLAQKELGKRLGIPCGLVSMNILSFHMFQGEEIF